MSKLGGAFEGAGDWFGNVMPEASTQFQRDLVASMLQSANQGAQQSGSPIAAGLTPLLSALIGSKAEGNFQEAQRSRDQEALDTIFAAMNPGMAGGGGAGGRSAVAPAGAVSQTSPGASAVPQNVDFNLEGKRRPNPPNAELIDLLNRAATGTFGDGTRVVIDSGQENPGDQHGSNRHRTGLAADFRVLGPDGKQIGMDNPMTQDFLLQIAQSGGRGIGAGPEYMGNSFHVDMVPHDQYGPNQGPVWGSYASGMRDQLVQAMTGQQAPSAPAGGQDYRGRAMNLVDSALTPRNSGMGREGLQTLAEIMSSQSYSEPVRDLARSMLANQMERGGQSPQDQLGLAQDILQIEKMMRPPEPGQRRIVQGADGYRYYADTRERVLPNVTATPGRTPTGQNRQANEALERLEGMIEDIEFSQDVPRDEALRRIAQDPIGRRLIEIAGIEVPSAPASPQTSGGGGGSSAGGGGRQPTHRFNPNTGMIEEIK